MMSVDELLARLSIAEAYKCRGNTYIVSPEIFRKMEEAIEYYIKTGEVVEIDGRLIDSRRQPGRVEG
jgi:hypothetical protein